MKPKNTFKSLALAIAVIALVSVVPALALPAHIFSAQNNFSSLRSSFEKTAKPDISGKWDLNVTTDNGPVSAKAEFKVAADGSITGTVESAEYGSSKISSGSATDTTFVIRFGISADGNAIDVSMNGTYDEKSLKGTGSAGDLSFSFTGTRSSSAQ
jgi:hypothetical protein